MLSEMIQRIHQDHDALNNLFKTIPRCLDGTADPGACQSNDCGHATDCSRSVRSWLNLLFVFSKDHFARERSMMTAEAVPMDHLTRHDREHGEILAAIEALSRDYYAVRDLRSAMSALQAIAERIRGHTTSTDVELIAFLQAPP